MTRIDIQTVIHLASTAPDLDVRYAHSVEVHTRSPAPSQSPPPTDLEIDPLIRPRIRAGTALPRPSGVTRAKGGRRA